MQISRWKKFRYRMEWLLLAGVAWSIPRLPRRICLELARFLGSLAYQVDRRGREVALANLAVVFGARYGESERRSIARRSYQNFARTMLDLFWSPRLTQENWRNYIEMAGDVEGFLRTRESDPTPGGVIMCVHWGNFEWASLGAGFLGSSTMIVTETFKNARLSTLFSEARATSGHTIISQENSMIRLLKVVKRGGLAGMLIDLTFPPGQVSVAIDAFGHKMSVTFLHAVLAQRGGALLIPMHGEPLPDGRVRAVFESPISVPEGATPQQIAQICWDHFEPRIRERPELWMWAYKHWRYRPRAASPGDYPFYANCSAKFEELLAKQPASAGKKRA